MARNLGKQSFALDLKAFAEKAKGRMDTAVRKTVLELDARIVQRTPVDEGRAQNNWNIAADNPDASITEETEQSEQNIINEASREVQQMKAGGKIFITNNLPYIVRLENGYSEEQAPNGMVAVTLNEFPKVIVKAVKDSKRENP